MISYGRQKIDKSDIELVKKVLESDWLTQGPYLEKFEEALCKKFGSSFCSAVNNGTAALHLAGKALDWKKGDVIITTPLTFVSTANSIIFCGATPDFVDIDPTFYTLDVEKLELKLKDYSNKGIKVKGVIAVDYSGQPCDWKALKLLSKKYKFKLINDNCHGLGTEFRGSSKYAVKYADIVTQSYHPVKHITTGEGGSVLTNSAKLDKTVKMFRSHGIDSQSLKKKETKGSWYYQMKELGFNYRLTDFQAALGISQLKKLDNFVASRRGQASIYDKHLSKHEYLTIPQARKDSLHSYHLYPLKINFKKLKVNKVNFFRKMRAKNINLQVHYIPVHLQPYYQKNYGFFEGQFPISEEFYSEQVSIPIYPSLKKSEIKYVIDSLLSSLNLKK